MSTPIYNTLAAEYGWHEPAKEVPMDLTDKSERDALRALAEGVVSPLPWAYDGNPSGWVGDAEGAWVHEGAWKWTSGEGQRPTAITATPNAEYLAAAANALPGALDTIEALQRRNEMLEFQVSMPHHHLYARCFASDDELREYRIRQREHGERKAKEQAAKEINRLRRALDTIAVSAQIARRTPDGILSPKQVSKFVEETLAVPSEGC